MFLTDSSAGVSRDAMPSANAEITDATDDSIAFRYWNAGDRFSLIRLTTYEIFGARNSNADDSTLDIADAMLSITGITADTALDKKLKAATAYDMTAAPKLLIAGIEEIT